MMHRTELDIRVAAHSTRVTRIERQAWLHQPEMKRSRRATADARRALRHVASSARQFGSRSDNSLRAA